MADSPISTPHTMVAFAPTDAPRLTRVGVGCQSAFTARGSRSFVKAADGPMNTSSASSTPRYTDTLFCTFTRSPIWTPWSTKTFFPSVQPAPITEPLRKWLWCQMLVPPPITAPGSITAVG